MNGLMDFWTRSTVCKTMYICTANNGTTDDSVIARTQMPFSLFCTSFQLCPSVNLQVQCKADRTFITEEDSLYITCQEQLQFCTGTVTGRYFTWNRACNKYNKTISSFDMLSSTFAKPKPKFLSAGAVENFFNSNCDLKIIPSCLPAVRAVCFSSWMWQPRMALLYNLLDRLLPPLCSLDTARNYPYAGFLMACFQQTYRHSARYTCYCVSHMCLQASSLSDNCKCKINGMNADCKPLISCHSPVGRDCETETSCVNSSDFDGATLSDDPHDMDARECVVIRHRTDSAASVSGIDNNDNTGMLSAEYSATVPCHSTSAHLDDVVVDNDDYEDDSGPSLNKSAFQANCVRNVPLLTSLENQLCSTDDSHVKSSFFIRTSDSDASDCSDTDASDVFDDVDDDYVMGAAGDVDSSCWDDDDDDDDDDTTQCFLRDLDPFKISGLYIPQTSNVPISQSQCQSVPLQSAVEIETEAEKTLKRIKDCWQQCYNCGTKKRPARCRSHTKHVCVFIVG